MKTQFLTFSFRRIRCSRKGFALVLTILLLTLVALVAMGLLSLSSLEMRSSQRGKALAQARANARLGLWIAIGQLQSHAGPDQRITAPADVLERNGKVIQQPRLTGVWKSWENLNNRLTSAPSGSFEAEKEGRFLGWLVSHGSPAVATIPETSPAADAVLLSGVRQGVQDHAPVFGERMHLNDLKGSYAYAVLDEGVKANLALPDMSRPANAVERGIRLMAGRRNAQEILGPPFDAVERDEPGLMKTFSLGSYRLNDMSLTKVDMDRYAHAFTTDSNGLLIDVNEGGFKVDLSSATEMSGSPSSLVTGVNAAAPNYPLPWALLYQYCRQYKNFTYTANGEGASIAAVAPTIGPNDLFRCHPVLARVQYILSYRAIPTANPIEYEVGLVVTPVATLWNPYNVEIRFTSAPRYNVTSLPFSIQMEAGTTKTPWRHFSSIAKRGATAGGPVFNFTLNTGGSGVIKLKPGECMVFSPTSATLSTTNGGTVGLALSPGYRNQGGFFYSKDLNTPAVPIKAAGNAMLSVAIKPDVSEDDFQNWNVAYHCDSYYNNVQFEAIRINMAEDVLARYVSPLSEADTRKVSVASAVNTNQVCASMNMQLRTPSDTVAPGLGYIYANPLVTRSEYGRRTVNVGTRQGTYSQPLSLCWMDISLFAHGDWNDSYLPQIDAANHGFVASGVRADTGVPYAQISEVPLRPVQSICALQHFDYSAKSVTEFLFQVIGNSVANPTIPPGATYGGEARSATQYTHSDYSYVANALLFDKFFFSSIAPRGPLLATVPAETRESVYESHRTGAKLLPNSRYLPYGKTAQTDIQATASPEATIASRLMVAGAFNVNSTSITAWKTLLGCLNRESVAYHDLYGSSEANLVVADEQPYIVSRYGFPGGESVDHGTPQANQIPEELFWRGYRSLTEPQLQALAESIVRQVKQRGPFLSLGEFVNRRLSNASEDKQFATRGALQAALDDPAVTINDGLKQVSRQITVGSVTGEPGYVFPEAAEGYSHFAAPGWITQADILRPIAPYISARSDTFRVRAYGDALDGKGQIACRVWCEAVVQRVPEFVDSTQIPTTQMNALNSVNSRFGRQMKMISFRWLSHDEIRNAL